MCDDLRYNGRRMAGVRAFESRLDDLPPQRAAVAPRVRALPDGSSLQPLERVVRQMLDANVRGAILLVGSPGGGKTTALAHLRAALPPDAKLLLHDEPVAADLLPRRDHLCIVTANDAIAGPWLATFALADWQADDLIEYCVARRRDRCSSVLSRLRDDDGKSLLKGIPQLWHVVLDRLAADEELPDTAAALREHIDAVFPGSATRAEVAALCARVLLDESQPIRMSELPDELPDYAVRLLRHRAVRVLLAADVIAERLVAGALLRDLDPAAPMPPELLRATAAAVRAMPDAMARLDRMLGGIAQRTDAMAASILLAADPAWRPRDGRGLKLVRARLYNASWAGLDLRGAEMMFANLRGADLSGSELRRAWVGGADLSAAKLVAAKMRWLHAEGADFSGADLSRAAAHGGNFADADMPDVNFTDGDLTLAKFPRASLRGARLVGVNCTGALFDHTTLDDADVIGCEFSEAKLIAVRLAACANVAGVSFAGATLNRCELEGLRLPNCNFAGADLAGSYLTASFIPRGRFQNASLRDTGLADIDWPGADLRGADLRGCTFHMGSTRSGLVGSPIACEGSRTGFYTDDYNDRDFKPPEEIRKANLRGADLRGANVEGVDFYLVDLRDAQYTPDQAEHFAKCGAILRSRVA
jgi:uncharacterized protein YjbI with pentapeptide repeats